MDHTQPHTMHDVHSGRYLVALYMDHPYMFMFMCDKRTVCFVGHHQLPRHIGPSNIFHKHFEK